MNNSSSRSDSGGFVALMGALLAGGAVLQSWHTGWSAFALVWLVPALMVLAVWHVRLQGQQRVVQDLQAMAHSVAQGQFGRRLQNIPASGSLHDVCWEFNDMLDQLEACFREQATALQYASNGQYFRLAQPMGLRGTFHTALEQTNASLNIMAQTAALEREAAAEKLVAQEKERALANENLRIKLALDNVSLPVRIANDDGAVIYINQALRNTLHQNADGFRKQIPGFDPDKVVGGSISMFYADPQAALERLRNLKAVAQSRLNLGGRMYDLTTIGHRGLHVQPRGRTAADVDAEAASQSTGLGRFRHRVETMGLWWRESAAGTGHTASG